MSKLVQKQFNVAAGMSVPGFYRNSKIYSAYTIITDIYVFATILALGIHAFQQEKMFDKVNAFFETFYCNQILIIVTYLRWSGDRLQNIISQSELHSGETLSPDYWLTPKILPYIMNGCMTTTYVLWNLCPILYYNRDGSRKLATSIYYPFSYDESPNFELACLLEASFVFYLVAKMSAFYDLYVNLGARLIAKLTSLRKELPSVINDKNNVRINLTVWIKKHQATIRLGKEFNDFFSPVLFVLFSVEIIELTLSVLTPVNEEYDTLRLSLFAVYFFGTFFKLFVITRCGEHINYESSRIMEEGFGSRWYELPLKDQGTLKIITIGTNKSLTILALGVIPLNTETFKSIVMTAYSYITYLAKYK